MAVKLFISNLDTPGPAEEVIFEKDRITIGRGSFNDVTLENKNRLVSTRHAEMVKNGGGWQITDLASANATYLNSRRLVAHQPHTLEDGDHIKLGDFTLQVGLEQTRKRRPKQTKKLDDDTKSPSVELIFTTIEQLPLDRREDALQRAVEELAILNELAFDISGAHEAEVIIDKIVRRAVKASKANQGLITLVGEQQQEDVLMAQTLVRQFNPEEEQFHVNQSLLSWMQRYKKPLRLNNPRHEAPLQGIFWDVSFQSVLCVPLMTKARLTGILTVCDKRDPTGFNEADERLLAIMGAQSAQVIEQARLYKEEQRLGRMQEELKLAYEIQTNLLPKAAPQLPGYDLAGASVPAQTVGGDYFDYIPVDENRLAVCVGDVMGKGLPASLLMANAQATVRGQTPWTASVAECLVRSNKLLFESTSPGAFVTLFYGMLDTTDHCFRYSNAGHNRPLLIRQGQEPEEIPGGGLVLGAVQNFAYKEAAFTLAPGDVLLIYSDGIPEARNRSGEQFGEARLAEVLKLYAGDSAQAIIDAVLHAVKQFAGTTPQTDDITLLVVQRVD